MSARRPIVSSSCALCEFSARVRCRVLCENEFSFERFRCAVVMMARSIALMMMVERRCAAAFEYVKLCPAV